jgi:hypothetical protein
MWLCHIPTLTSFASLSVLPAEAKLRGKKATQLSEPGLSETDAAFE